MAKPFICYHCFTGNCAMCNGYGRFATVIKCECKHERLKQND